MASGRWCGVSALLPGAQQHQGVLDALLEDLIGELPVGQGAGELQCPGDQGEDAERLHACPLRIVRRQAGGDVVDDGQQAVGVRLPGGVGAAADLVEQGGGRAAVAGVVAVLDRKVFTHVLLDSGAAGRHRAEAFALSAELVGDRGGDQVFLGWEVGVEGAVGQPGVGHERRDPGAIDAVALEPAASRLDDPLPGRLLVFFPVPRHTLLRPPQGPLAVRRCSPTMIVRA